MPGTQDGGMGDVGYYQKSCFFDLKWTTEINSKFGNERIVEKNEN